MKNNRKLSEVEIKVLRQQQQCNATNTYCCIPIFPTISLDGATRRQRRSCIVIRRGTNRCLNSIGNGRVAVLVRAFSLGSLDDLHCINNILLRRCARRWRIGDGLRRAKLDGVVPIIDTGPMHVAVLLEGYLAVVCQPSLVMVRLTPIAQAGVWWCDINNVI